MIFKIILVDDESLILKGLRHTIPWRDIHCEIVATFENGQKALDFIISAKVDIVITDIRMPIMDGLQLLKEIQQLPDPPIVILLSGYDEFEYAKEGLKYQASNYILKPIDYEELFASVKEATKKIVEKNQQRYNKERIKLYEYLVKHHIETSEICSGQSYFTILIDDEEQFLENNIKLQEKIMELNGLEKSLLLYTYNFSNKQNVIVGVSSLNEKESEEKGAFIAEQIAILNEKWFIAVGDCVNSKHQLPLSLKSAKSLLHLRSDRTNRVISRKEIKQKYKSSRSSEALIEKALTYIKQHYTEDLSVEMIAEQVKLSPSYFSVIFKQMTQVNFLEYITNLRIEQACTLLETTDLKNFEIAEHVGYQDQRYFSQLFKKKLKVTPREYRKLKK